jgi:hypothetical protein
MPIAINQQTGQALRLDSGQWVPTQAAQDKQGNKLYFDGQSWVPGQVAPAAAQASRPPKTLLGKAMVPIENIPSDIAADFRAGVKTANEAAQASIDAARQNKDVGFLNRLKGIGGDLQAIAAPITGTFHALVGEPSAGLSSAKPDLGKDFAAKHPSASAFHNAIWSAETAVGKVGANTVEDVAAMLGPGAFLKTLGKIGQASEASAGAIGGAARAVTRGVSNLFGGAAETGGVTDATQSKAIAKVAKRIASDVKGGGATAQTMLDTIDEARKTGKALTLADVGGENVKALAGRVAREPGAGRNLARQFLTERDEGAAGRLTGDVNKHVATGSAYWTTKALTESRATGAAPLYEKAFQGGSIAPLQKQFEDAFTESTKEVSDASTEVNRLLNRMTQLKGKAATTSDVYSAASNQQELRELQRQLDQAEAALNTAQGRKNSVLQVLRQAQADGSANAPGAIWSPRIQQFLDDPVTKPWIARGLKIQRLEALAKGEPFNPTEYAITGTDEQGQPIVGKVPNMRLLNAAKKGMDAAIEENQDKITGRLNEDGRAIDMVRRSFLNELDRLNPDYKAAREYWSGESRSMSAVTWGRSILARSPEENAAEFAQMTDGEKEFAKIGAADLIRERILKSGVSGDEAKAIIKSEWAKQQLRPLFKSNDEFNRFIDSVTRERQMFETKRQVMGGSQTAERVAEDSRGDLLDTGLAAAEAAGHATSGNAVGTLRALMRVWSKVRNDPALNEAIARILFNPEVDFSDLSAPRNMTLPPATGSRLATAAKAGAGLAAQARSQQTAPGAPPYPSAASILGQLGLNSSGQ